MNRGKREAEVLHLLLVHHGDSTAQVIAEYVIGPGAKAKNILPTLRSMERRQLVCSYGYEGVTFWHLPVRERQTKPAISPGD